jgi:two-component system cell cycle sensor histidine kinase PleC
VQAGDSLTRNSNGLGLGLATAQRIIELHGGRLDLTSKPGEGTSARLVLAAA